MLRYEFDFKGDLTDLATEIETVEKAEILSIGKGLELIKDLGDATTVSDQYGLESLWELMELVIHVWLQSLMLILNQLTHIGHFHLKMFQLFIMVS